MDCSQRTLVNTPTNLRIPYRTENLSAERLSAYQEGLCFIKLQTYFKWFSADEQISIFRV
jgi:hypothetical protein